MLSGIHLNTDILPVVAVTGTGEKYDSDIL